MEYSIHHTSVVSIYWFSTWKGGILIIGERAKRARHSQVCSIENRGYIYILYVIVINQMRGLYDIYKSRDTRAKPECQGFMNRVQTERWFITIL